MKSETRIELVKMTEKAKRIQAEEYSGRWRKPGYVGAALLSLVGLYLMSSAITVISRGINPIFGALCLLVPLVFTLAPWYFLIRYKFNRNIQLLCEAILSVNQDKSDVAA
jgi:VIT1/CCC1 family predicted Fe2+/Mn2+ transporter